MSGSPGQDAAAGDVRTPAWSWTADWTEPVRRRPLPVALAALAVAALFAWRIGLRADLAAYLYLGALGVILSVIDISLKRLPDPLTLTAYPIAAALLGIAAPFTGDGGSRYLNALIGLAVMWALFAVQWFIVPRAIGLGDVKLAGVLGLLLGWLGRDAWMLGLLAMFMLGGLFSLALLLSRKAGRGAEIPFGPFMFAGAFVAAFVHL